MVLVVDVTKGIQTQTAECLVIGEITCDTMLVVINKVDLLPKEKREAAVEKVFCTMFTGTVQILYIGRESNMFDSPCTFIKSIAPHIK